MCKAEEPRAACHSLLPARLLPPTAYKADAAVKPFGRLPHGCIIHHPAVASCPLLAWLVELAALWPPSMKECSTPPLAEVISALLPSWFAMPRCQVLPCCPVPHRTCPIKYLLLADLRKLLHTAGVEEVGGCG